MARKATTGAYWQEKYLGKVVRWYWSTKGEAILNGKGHKLANSEDGFPIMDLNDQMVDINYCKYIEEAYRLLARIGIKESNKQLAA